MPTTLVRRALIWLALVVGLVWFVFAGSGGGDVREPSGCRETGLDQDG
ncbi:hypothetical protein [Streptomyces sp. DSM 40907]|nr:hypothetical protein [Streptomyces sp. DSM 40907]